MDIKGRNQLALAMLVSAKVFGIAGLVLGITAYRFLGGALLVFDGFLLACAAYLGIRNMKSEKIDERDQKQMLAQMMKDGTLEQYLRDLRADSSGKDTRGPGEDLRFELVAREHVAPALAIGGSPTGGATGTTRGLARVGISVR